VADSAGARVGSDLFIIDNTDLASVVEMPLLWRVNERDAAP
jgi:hypothetical protein